MLIPSEITGNWIDGTPLAIQRLLQDGCNCGCGWEGDCYLLLRAMPPKYGSGWAVLVKEPGDPAIIIFKNIAEVDHRIVTAVRDARRNRQNMKNTIKIAEAHDAAVDQQVRRQEAELIVGISEQVGHKLRKEGKVK